MGRQADCSSRSDISENKSDLPPLTKWPSAKSKDTSKPSMHGKLGNIPAAEARFLEKTALRTGSARETKKSFSFTAFF